jgi:hypothetical protein
MYGGRFTSPIVLEAPAQWFDFYFPGADKFTIWNATIFTAKQTFWDNVESLAFDKAWALLSSGEQQEESRSEFEPASWDAKGKVLSYSLVFPEKRNWPQFGERTFQDYCLQLEREIAEKKPPTIFESFRIDRSFRYGIGLYIVMDVEDITQGVIEQAIDRFIALGETNWRSPNPIPLERLRCKV